VRKGGKKVLPHRDERWKREALRLKEFINRETKKLSQRIKNLRIQGKRGHRPESEKQQGGRDRREARPERRKARKGAMRADRERTRSRS